MSLAQDYYDMAVADASFAASLKAARKALLQASITGETYGSILSASKNGASASIRIDVSTEDRRKALSIAVKGLDAGSRPSRTIHYRF